MFKLCSLLLILVSLCKFGFRLCPCFDIALVATLVCSLNKWAFSPPLSPLCFLGYCCFEVGAFWVRYLTNWVEEFSIWVTMGFSDVFILGNCFVSRKFISSCYRTSPRVVFTIFRKCKFQCSTSHYSYFYPTKRFGDRSKTLFVSPSGSREMLRQRGRARHGGKHQFNASRPTHNPNYSS